MATRTSSQTGPLSSTNTWGGAAAPTTGDIIVVSSGHIVTVDVSVTLGNKAAAGGHAFNIAGASSSSYGTLVVPDGVTLTLRGYDKVSNTMGLINRYGKFIVSPGATILGDVSSSMSSFIDNRGIIEAIGTNSKYVTFSSPPANYSWATSITGETFSGSAWKYDPVHKVACVAFTNGWISNSAGTGPGAFGDASIVFSAKTPSTILTTEVATLVEVTSVGKYFVNYDIGAVFFYHDPVDGNPAVTKAYKYLTFTTGWGISSIQSTTYNEAKFEYCSFKYIGPSTGADSWAVEVKNKKSSSVSADQLFALKNCDIRNCYQFLGIKTCDGTSSDKLKVTGNYFGEIKGNGTYGYAVSTYRAVVNHIDVSNNTLNTRLFIVLTAISGTVSDYIGFDIKNNSGTCCNFISGIPHSTRMPSSLIDGNNIIGAGQSIDSRMIQGVGGSSSGRLIVSNNTFTRGKRGIHYGPYATYKDNTIVDTFHHQFTACTEDDVCIQDVTISGNVICGEAGTSAYGYDASPNIELGYNHRIHLDNFLIENNTCVGNTSGLIGFGDMQDANTYSLITRVQIRNNASMKIASGGTAFVRRAIATDAVVRVHVSQFDYNSDYGYTTRFGTGLTRQGTFTGLDSLPGVGLHSPSFSSKSNGSVALTVTSDTDQTIKWGAGSAVQLVLSSGTATSASNNSVNSVVGLHSGVLNDTTKSWSTTKNNASCPILHWVKITGGTGVGQVRAITNNTATALTVVPSWTTLPDATSSYVIIKSEVALADGSESLQAGIYLPSLPTTSTTVTGISFADNSITGSDPLFALSTGTSRNDFTPSSSSPLKSSGYLGSFIGAIAIVVKRGVTIMVGVTNSVMRGVMRN